MGRTIWRNVEYVWSRPGATSGDVKRLEELIGSDLPDDYVQFLLAVNGGRPIPGAFTVPGTEFRSEVNFLYGLSRETDSSNLDYQLLHPEDGVGSGNLLIATELSGNLILLETTGPHKGYLVYADIMWEIAESNDDDGNVHFLSRSFGHFVDYLAKSPLSPEERARLADATWALSPD